jgi:hypothetical protein
MLLPSGQSAPKFSGIGFQPDFRAQCSTPDALFRERTVAAVSETSFPAKSFKAFRYTI